jgi:hypothetical protein
LRSLDAWVLSKDERPVNAQEAREVLGTRSDIYALGVLLYD